MTHPRYAHAQSDPVTLAPTATEHATATYLPEPKTRRAGVALCLSGGGFRATLFHLGALRRLNELGVLGHVDTVTSVSGGSIMSAFLAARIQPWPEPGAAFAEWDRKVAAPVRAFCRRNLRTMPVASSLQPWN